MLSKKMSTFGRSYILKNSLWILDFVCVCMCVCWLNTILSDWQKQSLGIIYLAPLEHIAKTKDDSLVKLISSKLSEDLQQDTYSRPKYLSVHHLHITLMEERRNGWMKKRNGYKADKDLDDFHFSLADVGSIYSQNECSVRTTTGH